MKAARPSLPVGVSLTTQEFQAVGENSIAPKMEAEFYGGWIDAARTHADFVGVQTYTAPAATTARAGSRRPRAPR